MRALVGLQRQPNVIDAKLHQLVAFARFDGVDHLAMLGSRSREQKGIADGVAANAKCFDPNALDHSGKAAVVARREHGAVKFIIESADTLEVVLINSLTILIVDRLKPVDECRVGGKWNTAGRFGLQQRAHLVDFFNVARRKVTHYRTLVGAARDKADFLKIEEGRADKVA